MLWFIIGVIIVVCIIIHMIRDEIWTFGEICGFGFMWFLAIMICALLAMLFSSAIAEVDAAKTYSVTEDIEIYALQDDVGSEGEFFIGSGHISNELKYFYVEKTELGYTVRDIDADCTYIQYTTDRCHIEKQAYTFDNWFVRLIAIPMSERYVIYIPEGSIVNNYTVDLK